MAKVKAAARSGASVRTRYFQAGFEIRSKAACNLVTDADVEAAML